MRNLCLSTIVVVATVVLTLGAAKAVKSCTRWNCDQMEMEFTGSIENPVWVVGSADCAAAFFTCTTGTCQERYVGMRPFADQPGSGKFYVCLCPTTSTTPPMDACCYGGVIKETGYEELSCEGTCDGNAAQCLFVQTGGTISMGYAVCDCE